MESLGTQPIAGASRSRDSPAPTSSSEGFTSSNSFGTEKHETPPEALNPRVSSLDGLSQNVRASQLHPVIKTGRHHVWGRPPAIRIRATGLHEWENRSKRIGCIQCRIDIAEEKKLQTQGLPVINIPHKDRSGGATVASRGCKQCNVALCVTRDCWDRFHAKA